MRQKMFTVINNTNIDSLMPETHQYPTLGAAVNKVKKGLKKKEGPFTIISPTGETIDLEHYLKA